MYYQNANPLFVNSRVVKGQQRQGGTERERADEKEASGQPYKECYDCNLQL